jgi:hypothetical protein
MPMKDLKPKTSSLTDIAILLYQDFQLGQKKSAIASAMADSR